VFFFLVGVQEDTCVSSVGIRWAELCRANRRDSERRPARNFFDEKSLLVGEIPGTPTNGKPRHLAGFTICKKKARTRSQRTG
jgi:hypothetical protein